MARPVTTAAPQSELLNRDNPRYSQDAAGQWWYKPIGTKDHARTRAYVATCPHCGREFLANIFHRKDQRYCSKSCGLKAFCAANPDRYRGEKGGNWRGGRRVIRGYVWVWAPDHPSRAQTKKPYVLEHRLVMERTLGRSLEPHEVVHHKNGKRDDNRPENLELWVKQHPPGARLHDAPHCPTCTCDG